MANRGTVLHGARARFTINGVKVAYATNVSMSEEITQEPVECLDNIEVEEHVSTGYRVTLSAQFMRLVKNPIKNRDGVVIFPSVEDILTHEEMNVAVEDSITGTLLATVQRVKPTRYTQNIGARGTVLTDVEFVAIRILDESEIR